MGYEGEEHLKNILKDRNWDILGEIKNRAAIIAYKGGTYLIDDEKDWKSDAFVRGKKIYYRYGKNTYFIYATSIKRFMPGLIEYLNKNNIKGIIICCFVISCKRGRLVDVVFDGCPIFIVARQYFKEWLFYLERTFLGKPHLEKIRYIIENR